MTPITIHEKHMARIDAVNNTTTEAEHQSQAMRLDGWRAGIRDAGGYVNLIAADLEQMDARGVDRPMCCGVFLDWQNAPMEARPDGGSLRE